MIDGILIRMNGYEGKKHFQNELLINRKHPLVARISLTMVYSLKIQIFVHWQKNTIKKNKRMECRRTLYIYIRHGFDFSDEAN